MDRIHNTSTADFLKFFSEILVTKIVQSSASINSPATSVRIGLYLKVIIFFKIVSHFHFTHEMAQNNDSWISCPIFPGSQSSLNDLETTFPDIESICNVWLHRIIFTWREDCFYYCSERNNVVVLFGTLKVQSFILTEVSDCGLLIVVTSSTFLKRKDILKEKSS